MTRVLTKNKFILLKLFYSHPEQQFYIHEIARILKKKPGVFQRALNNLEKEGVLSSEYRANARYFRVNTTCPIYKELKSIILKSARAKNILAILVPAFIFVLAASGAFCQEKNPKPGRVLTLKESIETAFKNNKDLQIQEKEVDASKANIISSRSNFLPKLNANYSYTYNKKVPIPQNVVTGYNNDNLFELSFSENLFNGGADWAAFKQSLLNLKVQNETLRAKKLDVEFEAKRLYYGLLLAYEIERIAQEQVDLANAHYEDVKKKFEQGTASRFDVLQSSVQASLTVPELVKARNNVQLITAEFNKLLGFKVNEPLIPRESLTYKLIDIKEGEFLQIAYLNKPEMMLKTLGIDISKWSINMAKAGYRPQVGITGDYMLRSNNVGNMFNSKQNNWGAGVQVSVPIFDSSSSKAKVDMAKSRYAESLLDKANLVDQIAVDIRQACLNLRESEAIINSQKDNVEEAREALKIANISYDNGVGTNLDVLDAQVSLGSIQNNLAQGIYDYLMAEASLDRTMGKSYVVKEVENEKKS
ncbi:MAG: TolC family protein [Candidatus Omnitrophica bacterium]|nr:TolC family protein [Candidatus Omnitrophota bacterium]